MQSLADVSGLAGIDAQVYRFSEDDSPWEHLSSVLVILSYHWFLIPVLLTGFQNKSFCVIQIKTNSQNCCCLAPCLDFGLCHVRIFITLFII